MYKYYYLFYGQNGITYSFSVKITKKFWQWEMLYYKTRMNLNTLGNNITKYIKKNRVLLCIITMAKYITAKQKRDIM